MQKRKSRRKKTRASPLAAASQEGTEDGWGIKKEEERKKKKPHRMRSDFVGEIAFFPVAKRECVPPRVFPSLSPWEQYQFPS